MSKLERKIKHLEKSIENDKRVFCQNEALLMQRMGTPQFILPALVGSFCIGYFVLSRYSGAQIKQTATAAPRFIAKVYKTISPFLTFII